MGKFTASNLDWSACSAISAAKASHKEQWLDGANLQPYPGLG